LKPEKLKLALVLIEKLEELAIQIKIGELHWYSGLKDMEDELFDLRSLLESEQEGNGQDNKKKS